MAESSRIHISPISINEKFSRPSGAYVAQIACGDLLDDTLIEFIRRMCIYELPLIVFMIIVCPRQDKNETSTSQVTEENFVGLVTCTVSTMAPSIVLASLLLSGASAAASAFDGSRFLWFDQPARQHFFEDAMPIGNGRLGATVYGGGSEVIGINENSIWTGPFQDRISKDPQTALAVTREMLLAGRLSEARQYSMANLIPETFSPRAFSYFGNIEIDFGHEDLGLTDYVRWLDTKEGTTGVSYAYAGVDYSSVAMPQFQALME